MSLLDLHIWARASYMAHVPTLPGDSTGELCVSLPSAPLT